jgi:hypothetical protein
MTKLKHYPGGRRAASYEEYMQWTDNLLPIIADFKPQEIIGVARGGMIPAARIAIKLGLPLGMVSLKSQGNTSILLNTQRPYERLVFIDDSYGSGNTARELDWFIGTSFSYENEHLHFIQCVPMVDLYWNDQEWKGRVFYGAKPDFIMDSMPFGINDDLGAGYIPIMARTE